MLEAHDNLPEDVAELQAMLAVREEELVARDAEIRVRDLLIEKLKHQLAGMRRHRFAASSETMDQLALSLEEQEIAAAACPPETSRQTDAQGLKDKPKRKPLPDHLPRHEQHLSIGEVCGDCGGKLRQLGEDVTEELEYVPGRFVVNRIVRPRMACGGCEAISQAALPSRPIERGRPGPGLLAHVLVSKYADHLPLYRQSQIFARDGVDLERSTLTDWVGPSTALLAPLADAIGRHVLAGQAIFADDTPVKLLAPGAGKTKTARFWAYQPVDEVFPGRSRHGLILWCPGLKGGSLMAMGQQKDRQGDLMVSWSEMPRSPGHVFYDRLQLVLIEGGFDGFAEAVCQPYYAARMGAPSVPPGRYFRMHLVGYFEGIDSERGLEWRCSDSLSLREFLLLEMRERVPDHSWLSRTRARLPHEVHAAVFDWVLALIAEAGLVKGERIGVDASTMEANAALRNIVRRDTGEGYRGMLERLAQESGIETPTAEDLARLDRKRKGKKLSNQDWVSRSDPEAKIAKMKDGTTHLAYKPEHAVDLDTGAVVAAELHPADEGDTTTLPKTLAAAEANLEAVDVAPTAEDPAECVTDKGYHSRLVLKALDDGPWKSRISEPKQKGFARWHGDDAARRAVTNNRTRLLSGVAREAFKLRAEIVERSFAHNLDRGGMRRTWLRGRENVHKRYLLHVAGHNLSLLMRQLIGAGTPKEAVAGGIGALFVLVTPAGAVLVVQIVLIVSEDGETAFAAICFAVA